MTKQEFLAKMEQEHLDLGATKIVTDHLTESQYVLGCYYDENMRKWRMYRTYERGGYSIIDEFEDENKAFDVFYKIVQREARATAKVRELQRRSRLRD